MGGFHIVWNFLGAIGYLMQATGVEYIMVEVCLHGTGKYHDDHPVDGRFMIVPRTAVGRSSRGPPLDDRHLGPPLDDRPWTTVG